MASAAGVPQYSPSRPQRRITKYPPLLLGKHPRKDAFLATYGQTFVMLAAPPGSGKGVGIVIPNLLSYPDSVVVNDPKFENWDTTAGFRAAMGQKVFRFSPERLETHRWNPLSGLRRDPLYRLGDIRSLASVLFVSDNPKNQEWYNKASNVFGALVLYLMETPELPCTLPQLYELASLGAGLGQWAQQVISDRSDGENALSEECRRELYSVYVASQNKSSGWSTTSDIVRDVLAIYGEKTVAWALSGDDIDFSKPREEKTSVYFCVTSNALKKFAPLMNLFFSQAINENSKVLPEQGGHCADGSLRLKHQLLFLIDEIAVMGRMEVMETAPALMRGAGLRFLIIFQSKDQLRAERTYGREGGDGIMKAFHAEIVYTPNDIELATEYSKRLGNTTVRVANDSVNYGDKRTRGRSYSEQARPLMLPQEVNELPYDEELIFIGATKEHPSLSIRARKIFWYEEPVFKERANMPPPALPTADLEKLKNITVPVRIEEKTAAVVAPHDEQIKAEQQKRTSKSAQQKSTSKNSQQ
ncbi:type IV secretory system conjugative DNA transfer family protein [Pseudomonas aeruginosa]|uniref:type IV secretory system conjugative DNA transfer family protein n=1 Tax=Pseudomonas aeruginosa TaxID=287 RepID=UPI003AFB38B3